ncbi:MAG: glycosyl hydrolase-related protein, partial [Actinomycetota bacterium]
AIEVRVYNAGDEPVEARLTPGDPLPAGAASLVGLLGDPRGNLGPSGGTVVVPLRPWEIATVRLG